MKTLFVFAAVLGVMWLCFLGCEKNEPGLGEEIGKPPAVKIIVLSRSDTVRFLTGDSVSVGGYAEVTDDAGIALPEMRVLVTVAPPDLGFIEAAGNATDSTGRVYFTFRTFGQSSFNTVTIRAEVQRGASAHKLWLQPLRAAYLTVVARPDTLHRAGGVQLPDGYDTVYVSATLTDSVHVPIPEVNLRMTVSDFISVPFSPTNTSGIASGYWFPISSGWQFVVASFGRLSDTAWVFVVSPYPSDVRRVQIVMMADTLRFLPGDSVSAPGYVEVRDESNHGIAAKRVYLTLLEPFGWLEFLNPALMDDTDTNGRVNFAFHDYGDSGTNTIFAGCDGISDLHLITVLPGMPLLGSLNVYVNPSVLHLHGVLDSVQVLAIIADSVHHGIPNITIPITVTSGTLGEFPPTDSAGRTSGYWYLHDTGYFSVEAHAAGLVDTAWVTVDTLSRGF